MKRAALITGAAVTALLGLAIFCALQPHGAPLRAGLSQQSVSTGHVALRGAPRTNPAPMPAPGVPEGAAAPAHVGSLPSAKRVTPALTGRPPPAVPARTLDRWRTLDDQAYQRLRDRSDRARHLDARLERHLQRLEQQLAASSGAERERLQANVRTVQRQLHLRRRQELVAAQPSHRPGTR